MVKIGYADPPYPGQVARHYPDGREVHHAMLIAHLDADFDCWALSTSSPALFDVLPLCPEGTRVAAWVKPFASFKPNVNPAYAWEPVLFKGSRKRERTEPTVRDWTACNITLERGLAGAKPDGFWYWLFDLLGVRAEDEFVDLFPGTGRGTKALEAWLSQTRMAV